MFSARSEAGRDHDAPNSKQQVAVLSLLLTAWRLIALT